MRQRFSQRFRQHFKKSTTSATPGNAGTDKATTPDSSATIASAAQVQQHQSPPDVTPPYACTYDLWQEAFRSLNDADKHNLEWFNELQQNDTTRGIAADIGDKIHQLFDEKEQDKGVKQIIERSVAVLNKFLSVGDVVASFDPVHAALPWAAVRSVLMLLAAPTEVHGCVLAGISQVATLLAQCDTYQQLYMTGSHTLRPPEASLEKLRLAMIEAYIRSQKFIGFATESLQKRVKLVAVFKLDIVREHVRRLSESQQQVQQVAHNCEAQCSQTARAGHEKLFELTKEFAQTLQHNTELILETINDKEQLEVLDWISNVPYGSHHLTVKEARTGETCQWLIDHKSFIEWDTCHGSSVLWLHGPPGTGKTFLMSKVIDHVQSRRESKATEEAFAYFYCNRNEECRREPLSILRALVRQSSTIPSQPRHIRKQLLDICREARSKSSHLGFESCRSQLLESVNSYSQTTIILDAMDECSPDQRWRLMEIIQSLICESQRSIKVFIASRPDDDIKTRYSSLSNVEIYAADNQSDIEKYINEEIDRPRVWGPISPSLRVDIVNILRKGSQGMFQWAYLQIKQVLELPTENDIRARLGKFPPGLKEAYDEIYASISEHPGGKAIVDSAIMWIMGPTRNDGGQLLLDAVCIRIDTDSLDFSSPVSESCLLSLCRHLLVFDSKLKRWRFSHLSVLEYFESSHWSLLEAYCNTSKICLRLLLTMFGGELNEDPNTRCDKTRTSGSHGILHIGHKLREYVWFKWYWNVQKYEELLQMQGLEPDRSLSELLKRFLGAPDNTSAEYRKWLQKTPQILKRFGPPNTATFLMCRHSIHLLLRDWWDGADISAVDREGYNLLTIAAVNGHRQMCELLIRRGIQVNQILQGLIYGSALIAAAIKGSIEIMQCLLDHGADVNMLVLSEFYGSALVAAAARERVETVQCLLDNGVDVNMLVPSGFYGSALVAAAAGGSIETVQCLLDHGANPNLIPRGGKFGSALEAASLTGNAEVVRCLIERGADVNVVLPHGECGSALAAAAFWGQKEAVVVLLEAGADVDLRMEREHHATAMEAARSQEPLSDMVHMLNSYDWWRSQWELLQDREEVMEILEQWRDKNAQGRVDRLIM